MSPYDGVLDKNLLTIDEDLELANRFLKQMPTSNNRDSFALQSNYVGIAKMCKRFLVMMSTLSSQKDIGAYRSAKPVPVSPEKMLIYKVFVGVSIATVVLGRRMKP